MNLYEHFPNEVAVTEQTFDISYFSDKWKKNVAWLGEQLIKKYQKRGKKRYVVAFAGASGSSKSTTAKALENILKKAKIPIVVASLDGYHYEQNYLLKTLDNRGAPLAKHKGRYDSFDVSTMKNDLGRFIGGERILFPEYSRRIHNPIANAIPTDESTLLIFEGLWLLYDNKPWNELLSLYDLTVFFHASPEIRKQNTITRHIRGNEHNPTEAELFYEESDAKNAKLILSKIAKHDIDFYF